MGVMFVLIIVCNIFKKPIWILNERNRTNNLRRFQNCHAKASQAHCSKFIYSQFDECKSIFFLVNFFPFSHKNNLWKFWCVCFGKKCFSFKWETKSKKKITPLSICAMCQKQSEIQLNSGTEQKKKQFIIAFHCLFFRLNKKQKQKYFKN